MYDSHGKPRCDDGVAISYVFKEIRMKCSIMWCPWKAKYSFGMRGYYECWFHGENTWIGFLWDMAWIPIRYFYSHIRYGFGSYGNILSWYKLTWNDFIEGR